MKLERYRKVDGAFSRMVWREVPDDSISDSRGKRDNDVQLIIVTVTLEDLTTHQFQADEVSQERLARYGWAMTTKGTRTHIPWKTLDNVWVMITPIDIANIIEKAGDIQAVLWGYQP